ncbi:TauD/TfdA family dioxygenase [Bradyrhizobium sp. BR 10261]|nr:TauD/TfdA family dioxygenase [Bradyrhizobium sp. BR 10261]
MSRPQHDLTPEDFPLPVMGRRLAAVVSSLETGRGFALLRGLPVEDLSEDQARLMAWGVGLHVGVALPQNANGALIHDVRDRGESSATTLRGNGSTEEIAYHVDPCDVVALFCRRVAAAGGESFLCSSRAIHDTIRSRRPDLLDLLYQPFHFAELGSGGVYACPIFGCADGFFTSHYYKARILKAATMPNVPRLTEAQLEAIDLIQKLASDPKYHIAMKLKVGDLQLVNNHVVYHRRSSYDDHSDPDMKRHLFRLWFAVPGSRPLDSAFGGFWNQTAASTVRGGAQRWNRIVDHVTGYQRRLAQIHGLSFDA